MNPAEPQPPYLRSSAAPSPSDGEVGGATDDASLLRRMAAGDELALGIFYDRWHPLVHGVVMRILKQQVDVDETVEEAFWQAWRQAGRYEPSRGGVQTWLLTIARSRALDRARTLKRRREEPLVSDDGAAVVEQVAEDNPSLDAEAAERRAIIQSALAELPIEQREALELGYFSGLSQTEIAAQTGQPLGTIKTRVRLALQKLRNRLQILHESAQ